MDSIVFPDASYCLFPSQTIEGWSVNPRSVSFSFTFTAQSISSVQTLDLVSFTSSESMACGVGKARQKDD